MRLPKYRRFAARDKAFVEFNGKRSYLPGRYKSPESVAAYRRFLHDNGFSQIEVADAAIYVAEVAAAFLEWAIATYPPGCRSEAANCRAAINHLIACDRTTAVLDYGPRRLKALQLCLAEKNKSRAYINAVCSRIKRAFKWAASEELIPVAIYQALATVPGLRMGRTAAKEPPKRQPVQWEHVKPVLAELSPTVAAMVQLQWNTGARSQSVCLARAEQFDRSKKLWQWRPRHKMEHSGREVVIPVGPRAQKVLKPLFDGRDFLFAPKHLNGRRARGYRSFYDSVSYLRAVRRATDRANRDREDGDKIPQWTPHQLRHAFATRVRNAYGLEAAQAALNHTRLNTSEIYAQRLREKAEQVAREMG